ncbi:MAG: DMT family transporter [Alphaproteobacteria bacterium]|nr:DMT family transporter [Alphaproteobacteria bacterium]
MSSDSLVKLLGTGMPPGQIMALRGLMAVALAGSVLVATVEPARWRLALTPLVGARAALESVSAALFIMSLPHLPLSDITVFMQFTPLSITLLAALLLREHVGWRRWAAILVGFIGVLLVAQPGGAGFSPYAISAIMVALIISVRDLITRRLDPAIPTPAITLTTTLAVCLLGFASAPFEDWTPLSWDRVGLLAGSALLVTTANAAIIRAFRGTDVTVVSPFRYFGVLWAVAIGFAIWGEIPDFLAICGTVLIVGSGLYTMHRESLRLRQHQ